MHKYTKKITRFAFFQKMKSILIVLTFFLGVLCAQYDESEIDNIFLQNGLNSSIIGVSVKEVLSQKIIYEKNSHLQLVPASTFKLLITICGLEKLGADFRFITEMYYHGEIKNKTLNGNLIIKGYGDPTIESRFFKQSALQNICNLLKNKGIEKIQGNIIIDNSYFQPFIHDNWIWEDINNYYTAVPYPVSIYDNAYHIYFQSQEKERADILKIEPQYSSNPIIEIEDNQVFAKPGGDNAFIYGDPMRYVKRVSGSIPPNQKEYSIEGALPDPARMFVQELLKKFKLCNIGLTNTHVLITNKDTLNYKAFNSLGNILSPSLSEIVRLTNLYSINLFAEAILWAIGKGDYEKGKKEIINYLKQEDLNTQEVNIDDACGLSRLNGISADIFSSLLVKMYNKKNKEVFLNSLPVSGESGTMKHFSNTFPLKGNLRCKTGYIQRVRTYAGYINTKSGKPLAICLMYNNFNLSSEKIKQISKRFFETLYKNY